MYSQCPDCFAYTRVDAATLSQGRGTVRCSGCGKHYFALSSLSDDLPPPANTERTPQGKFPSRIAPVVTAATPLTTREIEPIVLPRPAPAPLPGFARQRAPAGRRWPWLLGSTLLALSFAAQIGYAERDWLLDDARVRPWLDQFCGFAHCVLPLRSDATQLSLLARDIRPHPSVPNALIISATLRNDAEFAQALPHVEISLSDLDEHRIAMRRFSARDYVNDSKTVRRGLAAGSSIALVFEVADPGKDAVAFEFKFY
ncbi:DUF3426 domain-containing protein [Pseudolysobacter antarcticus]|uniref:DUF3426 domain-containing protein n=1 Tax=Pseudolysobacter antarcticus TaxID=2511995 RepID=A0A411HQI0_9GAMM|nr:zinc-ribbon and DUF3426 domain-containing protein [Pseudolysobacter antarcticus]QBB72758.1 DUF3426 domain-containing protein [Pseudolysobacter antarcticus]